MRGQLDGRVLLPPSIANGSKNVKWSIWISLKPPMMRIRWRSLPQFWSLVVFNSRSNSNSGRVSRIVVDVMLPGISVARDDHHRLIRFPIIHSFFTVQVVIDTHPLKCKCNYELLFVWIICTLLCMIVYSQRNLAKSIKEDRNLMSLMVNWLMAKWIT